MMIMMPVCHDDCDDSVTVSVVTMFYCDSDVTVYDDDSDDSVTVSEMMMRC